jgi:aspartyl-tRNA(Asn)/glutamyl-tRNA(Gln) amidotransferase subunit C
MQTIWPLPDQTTCCASIEPPQVNLYNNRMSLPIEQIQHIANLARLTLTAEEISRYRDQLSAILDYFEQLQAIDTHAVSPTTSGVKLETVLRDDRVLPGLSLQEVLGNAPDTEGDQFRVPPVFD